MNAMNSGADTDKDLELFAAKVSPEKAMAGGMQKGQAGDGKLRLVTNNNAAGCG